MYFFDYHARKKAIEEDIRMGLSSYEDLEEYEEEYGPDPDESYDAMMDNLMTD